jgi:hypothetical protein
MKWRYWPTLFLAGLVLATVYWFGDSLIHYVVYEEQRFEFIPSGFNELWMRCVIVMLLIAFGVYAQASTNRMRRLRIQLNEAMTKLLGGFVSICSECKKIRAEGNSAGGQRDWRSIEAYIGQRTDLQFSHGYCPDCLARLQKEIRRPAK